MMMISLERFGVNLFMQQAKHYLHRQAVQTIVQNMGEHVFVL
jgi:hypothetical protein